MGFVSFLSVPVTVLTLPALLLQLLVIYPYLSRGFPGASDGKKKICLQCRRPGFIPWLGRSPGERNGYPLQYSCLENSMDREAWWATVHGAAKSQTWLNEEHTSTLDFIGKLCVMDFFEWGGGSLLLLLVGIICWHLFNWTTAPTVVLGIMIGSQCAPHFMK